MIPFLGFLYSCVPCFHIFSSDSQSFVVGFYQTIILLGLAGYEISQPGASRRFGYDHFKTSKQKSFKLAKENVKASLLKKTAQFIGSVLL